MISEVIAVLSRPLCGSSSTVVRLSKNSKTHRCTVEKRGYYHLYAHMNFSCWQNFPNREFCHSTIPSFFIVENTTTRRIQRACKQWMNWQIEIKISVFSYEEYDIVWILISILHHQYRFQYFSTNPLVGYDLY